MAFSDKPVVIAGGGLGGLTTALALGNSGWKVRVFEQAPEFGAIGYGIQLAANVFPVFEQLGIIDQVLADSVFPDAVVMVDAFSSEDITRIPTDDAYRARFKHPYVVIHRGDLHSILLSACRACGSIELEASSAVTSFDDCGDGARVNLNNGRTVEASVLVGADGLYSAIRAQIVGDGEPLPIGYAAHRTIVPMEQVPGHLRRNEVVLWAGPALHIVHYPLRKGELFNIVAVFKTPTYAARREPEAYKQELLDTYRETHAAMRTLLGLMQLDRRWPIADRKPVRNWASGHAVLIGDAAHPTLQSYAQGAGMAIEDGLCLAQCIASAGNGIPEALKQFVRSRYVRTSRVQLESRHLWEVYHLGDPIAVEVRKAQFAGMVGDDYFKCLSWLWDGVAAPQVPPPSAPLARLHIDHLRVESGR